MLLAIDIENKTTTFGVFDGEDLITDFAIVTAEHKSKDEIRLAIKLILADKDIDIGNIENIIISSVVPDLNSLYEEIAATITNNPPILISAGVKTGIHIKTENPKEVGSDRIIRAVAATKLHDIDLIVVYASTITTIDYINSKKQFMGGLILPGLDLLEKSLHEESAKLPQVDKKIPTQVLGKSTVSSIQAGIYYSYQKAVYGIVDEIVKANKLAEDNTKIIVTGVHGQMLADKNEKIDYIPNLGLLGLRMVYELNNK